MVKFYNLINHQANNRHQKQHIKNFNCNRYYKKITKVVKLRNKDKQLNLILFQR